MIVRCSTRSSLRHCMFFRNENKIYVTDFKSAHGTFVNGVRLQPFQITELHLNDCIGIGYSTVENPITNDDIYAYELRAFQSLYQKDGRSVSASSGTSSSKNKETANYKKVADKVHKLEQNRSNLNTIQGKDKEKNKTHDKLNAERGMDMNTPTCSTNLPDKSAKFPKSKEDCREESLKKSEQLSKPLLSGKKKTEMLGISENDIKMESKKIEEQKAASLAKNREEKHIFPKPKVNITTESENDINLGQTIAGSGKEIATK